MNQTIFSPLAPSQAIDQFYVFRSDGAHLGPMEAALVAKAILEGRFGRDALVGLAGGSTWERADAVADIRERIDTSSAGGGSVEDARGRRSGDATEIDHIPVSLRLPKRSSGVVPASTTPEPKPAPEAQPKAELEPFLRFLPLFLFGVCGALSLVMTAATFVLRR